jgi:hypothetical protein
MDEFVLHSVNWQDGMLISSRHFEEQEKYLEELARWFGYRAGIQYGLISKSASDRPALVMNCTLNGSTLRVEIARCQALTRGGHAIEINEACQNMVVGEATVESNMVPVYLSIDPSRRKQVGVPDPAENIPRLPFETPEYALSIGQAPNVAEGSLLQIGLLSIVDGSVSPAPDYFPPCVSVQAHDQLLQKARSYRAGLETLLRTLSRAYEALGSTSGPAADAGGSLQGHCRQIIRDLAIVLAGTVDSVVTGGDGMHPGDMVRTFKRVFRTLSVLLSLEPGVKDFLNQRYFEREAGSNITAFLSAIDGFLVDQYNHLDIAGHVRQIDNLLERTSGVFGFFAQSGPITPEPTETITYQGKTFTRITYAGYRVEELTDFCSLLVSLQSAMPVKDLVVLMTKELFESGQWSDMQARIGLNEAKRLGETDPLALDINTFGTKVALRAPDMTTTQSVNQVNLVFRTRGRSIAGKFEHLSASDLIVYTAS